MPDMWSRSCSMLVILILRGFELSSRLDLYSLRLPVSNLFNLSLYLSVSCEAVVGWMFETRLEMN